MNKKVNIPEEIKLLIAGYLSGSLKPDELSALMSWINESPDNKKYFNAMRHTWSLSSNDLSLHEKEKTVLKFAEKLSHNNIGKRLQSFWNWQRMAASWVILFICAGALGWFLNDKSANNTSSSAESVTVIYAKTGSQTIVDMPDGTKVWLNGGSRLTYENTYGNHDREVQLTGEACFEVITNPEKPFMVKAGGLSIKALGTTFNVKAYPEDESVTTTLVKGKVVVEGMDENNQLFSIVMKPNDNITYRTEQQKPETQSQGDEKYQVTPEKKISDPIVIENNIKPELFTSWKDNLWIIEKQNLGNLSKDFERRYNVQIIFSSEDIKNYRFSGSIQNEPIEQVMKILRRTIPLKYSFDRNVISIDEDKTLAKEFILKNQ